MDITDPVIWRGIERLIIVLSAALFGFLGYRLYVKGISKSKSDLNVQSPILRFAVSGTGPGLLFMAFGALVLVWSVSIGGASTTETKKIRKLEGQVEQLVEVIRNVELQSFREPYEEIQELKHAINQLYLQNKELNEVLLAGEGGQKSHCKVIDSASNKGQLYCPQGYVLVGAENHPGRNDVLDKLICCPVQ